MSDEMTGVYSGGLMYEYSYEDNDFGIVKISGNTVKTTDEYKLLKEALKNYPMPTGSGGAAKSTHGVDCPAKEDVWQVDPDLVPEMPSQAKKYFTNGAGKGPGFDGNDGEGSHFEVDSGTATASVSAGKSTSTSSGSESTDEDDDSAASTMDMAPLYITGAATLFTLFGTLLL
jgi:hypothetical protein